MILRTTMDWLGQKAQPYIPSKRTVVTVLALVAVPVGWMWLAESDGTGLGEWLLGGVALLGVILYDRRRRA